MKRWQGMSAEAVAEVAREEFLCQNCLTGDRDWEIILCDTCNKAFHLDCHDPPLPAVPKWSWFCNDCIASQKIEKIVTPIWRDVVSLDVSSRSSLSRSSESNRLSFELSSSSSEDTSDEAYGRRHLPLELEQKKDRIAKSRTRRSEDYIDSFIRTVRRRRESSLKMNLPLLATPQNLLPPDFPCEMDIIRDIRLENRRLFLTLRKEKAFVSSDLCEAIRFTSQNMYLNWRFDDLISMNVEILESSSEEEPDTPSCEECGFSTRSWTIHFCRSCGKKSHLLCMKKKWVCENKVWTCNTCCNPFSNGHSETGAEQDIKSFEKTDEEVCVSHEIEGTGNGKKEDRVSIDERVRLQANPSTRRHSMTLSRQKVKSVSSASLVVCHQQSTEIASSFVSLGSKKRKFENKGNVASKSEQKSEQKSELSEWHQRRKRIESREKQFVENALCHLDRDHQFCICRSDIRDIYIQTPDWRKRKNVTSQEPLSSHTATSRHAIRSHKRKVDPPALCEDDEGRTDDEYYAELHHPYEQKERSNLHEIHKLKKSLALHQAVDCPLSPSVLVLSSLLNASSSNLKK